MRIRKIESEELSEYSEQCSVHGNIFLMPEWVGLFPDAKLFGIYDEGGHLIGGFYTFIKKKGLIKILSDLPFTPTIGPWIIKRSEKQYNKQYFERKILNLFVDFIDDFSIPVKSVSLSRNICDPLPFIWKKYKVTPQVTYVLDLHNSKEVLWDNFSSDKRNIIRKSEKDGVIVEKNNITDELENLILNTFTRKGITLNQYFLKQVLFTFSKPENSFCFTAYKDNEPLAICYCLYDRYSAYYLFGGYNQGNIHTGAGASAIWSAIQESKRLDLKLFDFEGSSIPEISKYFMGFGGEQVFAFRINKAYFPLEIVLKAFKRDLF